MFRKKKIRGNFIKSPRERGLDTLLEARTTLPPVQRSPPWPDSGDQDLTALEAACAIGRVSVTETVSPHGTGHCHTELFALSPSFEATQMNYLDFLPWTKDATLRGSVPGSLHRLTPPLTGVVTEHPEDAHGDPGGRPAQCGHGTGPSPADRPASPSTRARLASAVN